MILGSAPCGHMPGVDMAFGAGKGSRSKGDRWWCYWRAYGPTFAASPGSASVCRQRISISAALGFAADMAPEAIASLASCVPFTPYRIHPDTAAGCLAFVCRCTLGLALSGIL